MLPKLKPISLALAGIGAVLLVAAAFRGSGRDEAPRVNADAAPAAAEVVVAPAAREMISKTLHLTGEVHALRRAQIRAEIGGRVIEMPWRVGELVASGEILARLDGSKNEISIRQARAAVSQAEISLEQARRRGRRSQALFDGKEISVEKYDDSMFALQTAESVLEMRRAELESLERLAHDFEIRAPYDAWCGEIGIQVGDFVSPGTAAFVLVEAEGIKAVFQVPADHVEDFEQGAAYDIWVPALGHHVGGRVAAIAREADAKSRTFTVEVDLDTEKQPRAGMIAKLEATLDTDREAIFVPAAALVEKFGGSYLFVVEDGHVRELPVEIEQRLGERVAVSGALETGARVVVQGQHRLENGAVVRLVEAPGGPGIVRR